MTDAHVREQVPAALERVVERVVGAEPRLGSTRLVCIDGPAGSGKTSLAHRLVDRLRGRAQTAVVHLDDLYEGWSGLGGVWERVEDQLLVPLGRGRPARWQRYDWAAGAFADWRDLAPPDVLVLEGCGSAPRRVDGRAVVRLFVEAPPELCLSRGIARDGESLRAEWVRWQVSEATYFGTERTRERADVIIDGTVPLA